MADDALVWSHRSWRYRVDELAVAATGFACLVAGPVLLVTRGEPAFIGLALLGLALLVAAAAEITDQFAFDRRCIRRRTFWRVRRIDVTDIVRIDEDQPGLWIVRRRSGRRVRVPFQAWTNGDVLLVLAKDFVRDNQIELITTPLASEMWGEPS